LASTPRSTKVADARVDNEYNFRASTGTQAIQNNELEAWLERCNAREQRKLAYVARAKTKTKKRTIDMDAMKVAGLMVAGVVAVPFIAAANAEVLALIEVSLIGLLYVVRRHRLSEKAQRPMARVSSQRRPHSATYTTR
jgi:hypothetical protein